MGVDVVLKQVSQSGTSPKNRRLTRVDGVLDSADLFMHVCENTNLPMLSRVKPYGSLILTAPDMPQFISEIDTVRRSVERSSERQLLDGIEALAERCSGDASFELHLDGD
jgi:hypothetical protein